MGTSPSTNLLAAKIAEALAPIQGIRVAYLFGSHARGSERPDSDLDLAVSLDRTSSSARRGEALLDIVAALSAALGPLGERSDLLDLDRCSSTVAFRVIRDGRCVLSHDPRERVGLEAFIARRYDDERPYRELFRRAAVAAAARMGGVPRG